MSTGAAAAAATARAVSSLGASFMSDPAMSARGRELGFDGIDFYLVGRAGVVGEVDSNVATAALVFFHPDVVLAAWNRSAGVMSRREAAAAFASCAWDWADNHLGNDLDSDIGNDLDWDTLLVLTRRIVDAADAALAPLFAGWRTLPEPDGVCRQTVHLMNALREFRMARHAAALVTHCVPIGDAVRHRQPTMTAMFGWDPGEVADDVVARWETADAMTDTIVGQVYDTLDADQLDQFVALAHAAVATIH